MDSIRLKIKELLTHNCGCHCNLVTIATRYVVDACCPRNIDSNYEFNMT